MSGLKYEVEECEPALLCETIDYLSTAYLECRGIARACLLYGADNEVAMQSSCKIKCIVPCVLNLELLVQAAAADMDL